MNQYATVAQSIERLEEHTKDDTIKALNKETTTLTHKMGKLEKELVEAQKQLKSAKQQVADYRDKVKAAKITQAQQASHISEYKRKLLKLTSERNDLDKALTTIAKVEMPCGPGEMEWTDKKWAVYRMNSPTEFIVKNFIEDFSFKITVSDGKVELCDIAPPPKSVILEVMMLAKKASL